MKKIYLIFALVTLISCQKEELISTQDSKKLFSTASKKDALEHLTTLNSKNKLQNPNIEIYYDKIRQQPIFNSDELITIIPAQINNSSSESEILILNINGKIEHVLFTKISNGDQEHNKFNGILSITDLNGNFLKRYRVKDGLFTSQFFLKNKTGKFEDCTGDGWGVGLGCEQDLEEVVLIAPKQPANTVPVAGIYDSPDYQDSSLYEDQSGYIGYNSDEKTLVKVVNELDDPCASLIFTQMHLAALNTRLPKSFTDPNDPNVQHSLSEGIINLFNNSLTYDYVIKNAALINKNASTIGATTTLDSNYLKVATQLSIARTIIHEMLHAYLNLTITNSPQIGNKNFYEQMIDFARINGFHPSGSETERNRFQHEFMGGYVDAMAYSLYRWDQNHGTRTNLGWDYYFNLASAGLLYKDANGNYQYTDSFKNLFKDDEDGVTAAQKQNEAKKIIENEATNNTDAKGSDC